MKSVILAGGYAKRLWPITQDVPKALLELNDRPILDYIIKEIEKIDEVDEIFISTNLKFKTNFEEFLKNHKSTKIITLVLEPTKTEGEKFGAIGGLNYLINKKNVTEDLLILAGDNIFEFNILDFLTHYNKQNIILAAQDINSKELAKLYGVINADKHNKIIQFQEKPEHPLSTLIATAVYVFPKESLKKISEYLVEGNPPDNIGSFISWVSKNEETYVYIFKEKWFDIGSPATLKEAKTHYEITT